MTHNRTSPPRNFKLIIFLTVALVLNAVVLGWLGWCSYRSYRDDALVRQRDSRIKDLRCRILHLDEVLTMSARMAVATGDLQWEQRYHKFEPKLDAAIKEAIKLAPQLNTSKTVAKTDAANVKLVKMERQAFDLIRRHQTDKARSVLFSNEYERQKRIYTEGMDELAQGLSTAISRFLAGQQHRAFLHVLTAVLPIPFIVIGWFAVFRATRKWEETLRVNNVRLAKKTEELSEMNRSLDQRVGERTTELSMANKKLEAGIALRIQTGEKLNESLAELERFNHLAIGREERMIELKQEVNEMARKAGTPPPYGLVFLQKPEEDANRPMHPDIVSS
ncbi:hypothetical protein LCGC14_2794800 [marine sediment metagenome]|uniref:CHASE3 domain-containing protein n=1 Tax=marine sediment metagenome TaxID=412755 RepID=A0A0F8YPI2_9ZZZZ